LGSYTTVKGFAMFPSSFAQLIDFSPRPSRASRKTKAASAGDDLAPLLIRHAGDADDPAIERLAALDEREPPGGERLIALLAGRPVAAVEVRSGRTVADPFVPTSSIVELLALRAAQVRR
jgi:hypothetical protein